MGDAAGQTDKAPFTLPTLETERLILRPLSMDDAEAVYGFTSDPEVSRYVPFETHRSVADTIELLTRLIPNPPSPETCTFGMVLKGENRLIGSCGTIRGAIPAQRTEIGYFISRSCWGCGYAPEAARAVLQFAFTTLGMNRVEALCDVEHSASARVMEKIGMTYEGILREYMLVKGHYVNLKIYSILKKEWETSDW